MKLENEIVQEKFNNEYHKGLINLIYNSHHVISMMAESFKAHGNTLRQYNVLRLLKGGHPKQLTLIQIKKRILAKNVERNPEW